LRTVVPIVYALLVRWGLIEWLGLPDEIITYVVTAAVTGVFYILLRVLERYWDKIGWLIGYAARPAVYVKGEVIAVAQTTGNGGTQTTLTTPSKDTAPKTEGGAVNWMAVAAIAAVGILVILMLAFVDVGKSNGATPVAQQARYADFVQHGPVGNPQGFAVTCTSDGSTKWLYQGQYSQDKCPFNGRVNSWFVPAGYSICIRPYYNPGVGCQFAYSGGTWWSAPGGAWYAWTTAN
jgi:hypothetical protein